MIYDGGGQQSEGGNSASQQTRPRGVVSKAAIPLAGRRNCPHHQNAIHVSKFIAGHFYSWSFSYDVVKLYFGAHFIYIKKEEYLKHLKNVLHHFLDFLESLSEIGLCLSGWGGGNGWEVGKEGSDKCFVDLLAAPPL